MGCFRITVELQTRNGNASIAFAENIENAFSKQCDDKLWSAHNMNEWENENWKIALDSY